MTFGANEVTLQNERGMLKAGPGKLLVLLWRATYFFHLYFDSKSFFFLVPKDAFPDLICVAGGKEVLLRREDRLARLIFCFIKYLLIICLHQRFQVLCQRVLVNVSFHYLESHPLTYIAWRSVGHPIRMRGRSYISLDELWLCSIEIIAT